uniref:RxLR effector candidate protein n=1 Tax=Hyaloperonospora arabidopsidis (strain Emoy2) TaxID=559515 RepID=M4C5F9_HYAAE
MSARIVNGRKGSGELRLMLERLQRLRYSKPLGIVSMRTSVDVTRSLYGPGWRSGFTPLSSSGVREIRCHLHFPLLVWTALYQCRRIKGRSQSSRRSPCRRGLPRIRTLIPLFYLFSAVILCKPVTFRCPIRQVRLDGRGCVRHQRSQR